MIILFTICGRAGSKGVKNKNISSFCDNPLPYYSLSAIDLFLKKNIDIDADIVLSTDSSELIKLFKNNKIIESNIIKRSKKLAGDFVAKKDVIEDCYIKMREKYNKEYDIVVDLDITSPLRTVNDIEKLIKKHVRTGADLTYSVTSARRNPYFNQVTKGRNGYHKVLSSNYVSRQQAPKIYDMNASLYAYKPSYLLRKMNYDECKFQIIEMYDTGILDIDSKDDYELMQVIAKYLFDTKKQFKVIKDNI